MPLTALPSLTSADPNFDPRILPRPLSPSPPFSSPHLLLTRPLPLCQKDTTHRCLLPAARYPLPARGAHSHPFDRPRLRIFLPHLDINPSCSFVEHSRSRRAPSPHLHHQRNQHQHQSTQRPICRPSQPASKQASRDTVTQSNSPVCSFVRLLVCSLMRDGRFTDLLSPPTRRRLADWLSNWPSDWTD